MLTAELSHIQLKVIFAVVYDKYFARIVLHCFYVTDIIDKRLSFRLNLLY